MASRQRRRHGNYHGGGGGGFPKFGGGGGDGKGMAIVIVVVAAIAPLVMVAAIEGARWDGTVQVHPMMPIHLWGRDGSYDVRPLAWLGSIRRPRRGPITGSSARARDRFASSIARRSSAPASARSMYTGKSTMRSVWSDLANGTAFTIQASAYVPAGDRHPGLDLLRLA